MLSDDALVRALEHAGLSAPVRFDEVTRSTQATALEMAAEGAPEWTLVAAGHQTEGRGRMGRGWVDEPGRSLMFSFVLRPELEPEAGGLLTLLAGAAMTRACLELSDQRAACRWPNDLLVAGRKAGGILAESSVRGGRFEHVVIGVGVNIGAPPDVPGAGSVEAQDHELLRAFLSSFVEGYEPTHPAFAGHVIAAYRDVSATLGTRIRATTVEGELVEGEAVDLDERGGLVVRTAAGHRLVRFGELEHLK